MASINIFHLEEINPKLLRRLKTFRVGHKYTYVPMNIFQKNPDLEVGEEVAVKEIIHKTKGSKEKSLVKVIGRSGIEITIFLEDLARIRK